MKSTFSIPGLIVGDRGHSRLDETGVMQKTEASTINRRRHWLIASAKLNANQSTEIPPCRDLRCKCCIALVHRTGQDWRIASFHRLESRDVAELRRGNRARRHTASDLNVSRPITTLPAIFWIQIIQPCVFPFKKFAFHFANLQN